MHSVGIVGASGYTGLECVRLVLDHPQLELTHIFSRTYAGQALGDVFHQFLDERLLFESFSSDALQGCSLDVLILALPHNESHQLGATLESFEGVTIDLSADFRFDDVRVFESVYHQTHGSPLLNDHFVLGIPELKRSTLQSTDYIACPGCYSTSVMLALHPLKPISNPVVVDAKSGITGAGRSAKIESLYAERSGTFTAYTAGYHRHVAEIEQEIGTRVLMTNYLVPMNRGILSTCYISNSMELDQASVFQLFQNHYAGEPFVRILDDVKAVSTKYVTGTNYCFICPIVSGEHIIVFSVIDNLMKGAASQAIQCLNVRFGFSEKLGLTAHPLCS